MQYRLAFLSEKDFQDAAILPADSRRQTNWLIVTMIETMATVAATSKSRVPLSVAWLIVEPKPAMAIVRQSENTRVPLMPLRRRKRRPFALTGFAAVARFELPNLMPASFRY